MIHLQAVWEAFPWGNPIGICVTETTVTVRSVSTGLLYTGKACRCTGITKNLSYGNAKYANTTKPIDTNKP